jgi:tetratricopeptide (TPR) repeat protein
VTDLEAIHRRIESALDAGADTDLLAYLDAEVEARLDAGNLPGATTVVCGVVSPLLAHGRAADALDRIDRLLEACDPDADRAQQGRLWAARSSALRALQQLGDALEAERSAIALLDGIAPERAMTTLRHDRAVVLAELGHSEDAVAGLVAAREAFLGERDRLGVAACDHNLSFVLHDLGAYDDAIEYLTEARDIFLAIGMDEEAAACDQNLGVVLYDLGRFEEAGRRFAVAHHRFSSAGARRSGGECDANLATLLTTMGHLEEAERYRLRAAEVGVALPLAPGMSGQVPAVEVTHGVGG